MTAKGMGSLERNAARYERLSRAPLVNLHKHLLPAAFIGNLELKDKGRSCPFAPSDGTSIINASAKATFAIDHQDSCP